MKSELKTKLQLHNKGSNDPLRMCMFKNVPINSTGMSTKTPCEMMVNIQWSDKKKRSAVMLTSILVIRLVKFL